MKTWIRSSLFLLSLTGLMLAPLSEADAALAHLKLKGQKQGQIKGSSKVKGREGTIEVEAVSHEVTAPYSAASGLPTGKRQHKPLTITKAIDKSSPMLMSALTSNENISSWELFFYTRGAKGAEVLAYTIKLTNASITSIRLETDADGKVHEVVSVTYKKAEWTWADGGIMAEDDWTTPKA
jgi:type VI secretion system secreted protein Hcp